MRFNPLISEGRSIGQFDGNFKENRIKKPLLFLKVDHEHDVKSVTSL